MPVGPSDLTDDQLTAYIQTRLTVAGIDLTLLPVEPDPVTGAPTRAQALASLRSFVRATPTAFNRWRPPPATTGADPAILSQDTYPPVLYPSITEAWTDGGEAAS